MTRFIYQKSVQEKINLWYQKVGQRNAVSLGVVLLLATGLTVTLLQLKYQQDLRQRAAEKQTGISPEEQNHQQQIKDSLALQTQTNQIALLTQNIKTHPENKDKVTSTLSTVLAARKQRLISLLEVDPSTAANSMLTDDQLTTIQSVDSQDLEQKVTVTGMYSPFHIHDFKNMQNTKYYNMLRVSNTERYFLYSSKDLSTLQPGSQITVNGYKIGKDMLLVTDVNQNGEQVLGAHTSEVLAAKKGGGPTPTPTPPVALPAMNTAVVVTTWADTPSPSTYWNMSSIQSDMNTLSSYFQEQSFGKTLFNPTVFGPTQLAENQPSDCGFSTQDSIASQIVNETQNTINYTKFNRVIFMFPCESGTEEQYTVSYNTVNGTATFYQIFASSPVWGLAHALGHTLGGNPAGYLNEHSGFNFCYSDGYRQFDSLPNNTEQLYAAEIDNPICYYNQYGDLFDVMGSMRTFGTQFDSYHKYYSGWLTSANYVTVPSSAGTYTYTIGPLETQSTGAMVLNIPRPDGNNWLIEYRQPIGVDNWLGTSSIYCPNCNVTQGISIKSAQNSIFPGDNIGIDTSASTHQYDGSYNAHGALLPGQTFTDPEYGMSIKTVSATTSGATVQITMPQATCARFAPTVSVSPSSQSVSPGQAATYTITIKSTDATPCAPQNFGILPVNQNYPLNAPINTANFSADFYPTKLTLSPGQTGTISYVVTSPQNSQSATNTVYFSVNSDSGSSIAKSVSYQVSTPRDNQAPSIPTNLTAVAQGSGQVALSWNSSSDNVGVAGYYIYRDGTKIATVTNTSYTDYQLTGNVQYSYTVKAFDRHNVSATSQAVSVTTPATTDTQAPTAPTVNAVATGANEVTLTWSGATDNVGVSAYLIQRTVISTQGFRVGPEFYYGNWTPVAIVDGNTTSYVDKNLLYSTAYSYVVQPIDAAGNTAYGAVDSFNNYTNSQDVTTAKFGTNPPTIPTNVSYCSSPSGYTITWNPSTDDKGITGYSIYNGGVILKLGTSTTNSYNLPLSQSALPNSAAFRVQSVDTDGNVSALSPIIYSSASCP